jgi:hypothetical protein
MRTEIFTESQKQLLKYIQEFKRSYYLVGGTAIALYIGHRRSVDFDLFTSSRLNKQTLKARISKIPFPKTPVFEDIDQLHMSINQVKVTFFSFPYAVPHPVKFGQVITMPSLLSLAAMKAFALGRRSKWKDYVDLYFLIRDFFPISEISTEAEKLFPGQFSEKLFRGQLSFHLDIDFSEPVEFIGTPVPEQDIKNFLIEKATDIL